MKNRFTTSALLAIMLIFVSTAMVTAVTVNPPVFLAPSAPSPLSGVLTVGPTGNYVSITAALADLQLNGFTNPTGGVVFELQAAYNSSVETFPITITASIPTTVDNQLIIRPETGATGLVITNGSALAHTLYLNGAQYVTFDGRPGGAGTTSQLSITSGLSDSYLYNTIRYLNASNNSLLYCDITNNNTPQSSSPWAPGAIVWFANGTGNNNNTIDHCNIHGVSNTAGGIANNLLYILASPNTTISNNNFYDFGTKGNGYCYALMIGSCNGSHITGNSFYQTAAREVKYGEYIINLNGGEDYLVSGNYIGGTAPLCAGTPMLLTFTSFASATYNPIGAAVGNGLATSIQGNTIQNIQATYNERGSITCFSQSMGRVNFGTVTPNLIGSETVANSISIINNSPSSEGGITGFSVNSGSGYDFTNYSNNVISGISLSTISGQGLPFTGINAGSFYTAELVITNNTIGSTTLANSITNATPGNTIGINGNGRNLNTITGNTIANLTQSSTGTAGQLIGIYAVANPGLFNISGNTIRNLKSASSSTGTGSTASVIGIYSGSYNSAGHIISANTIHSLSNTTLTAAAGIVGIYYLGPSGGTNTIARNFIHSFGLATSSTSASLTGIYSDYSAFSPASMASFSNNMIRLGIDATGADLTTGYAINGIYDAHGTNSFFFNSVYIGGAGVTGTTSRTFAFNSAVLTNARKIQNNIFMNARSGGSVGKHYAITIAGTAPNPAGVTCGFNVLHASGAIGANCGLYNGNDLQTIAEWQAATGLDPQSGKTDPMFVNPTGNSSTVDLHVQATNPIEASGLLVAGVTTDFDGQTRSSLTPTDIGADAGNFTNSGDVFAPAITFTPAANTTSTSNRTLTGFAAITDNIAVSTGANLPRIYYKKSTDANAFVGNSSADNGWKYTVATNSVSPFNFTVDYSLLNGGSAIAGNIIQYFVVAQDAVNNFASQAVGATASSATNPVQNINAAPAELTLNSYVIINNTISGTVTIPGNYPNLTGAGGLFHQMNIGTVSGNVTAVINGDLVEDGMYALNAWTESPASSNFTLTIKPGSASVKLISGSIDNGLIRLNGADRVTIDGNFGGTGSFLEFYNTNSGANANTFLFVNDASHNTIQYCLIEGVSAAVNTNGIIYFSTALSLTGNGYNTIDHCEIFNPRSGNVAKFITEYNGAPLETNANSFNTISNCNIHDFFSDAGATYAIYLAWSSSNWTITGNSFYQTVSRPVVPYNMRLVYGHHCTNTVVSGNFMGGLAPTAGGAAGTYSFSGGAASFAAIEFMNASDFIIQNNVITNLSLSGSSSNYLSGIYISSGGGSINGNTIGSTSAANAITVTNATTSSSVGIYVLAGTTLDISNNLIGGITTAATTNSFSHGIMGILCTAESATITGNIVGSLTIPNSLLASTAANDISGQGIKGIHATLSVSGTIANNTIANLTSNYVGTGAGGNMRGIYSMGAAPINMTGNTVRNLKISSPQAGTGGASSIVGIYDATTGGGKLVTQNVIHTLENTALTGATNVVGMYYTGGITGTNTVSRNMIYGLSMLTAETTASLYGIYVGPVNAVFTNNVIRLGTTSSDADINTGYAIYGLYDSYYMSGISYYFNTVSLSGSTVSGVTSNTYAVNSLSTQVRNFRNNIFANTRSGGTVGKHYAITITGSGPGQANLTENYNDYFVSGTNGVLGYFNSSNVPNLATWKAAVGKDVNSLSVDPQFTSPTNLIPLNVSLVNGAGIAIAGITGDIDGTTRSVPPTMGAYEPGICINPTSGGVIIADQNGCAPFNPAALTSTTGATGHTGTLEYKWQSSVSPFTTWNDEPTSNSDTFDPAALNQTTKYKRLARVACKSDWTASVESNILTMTVDPVLPVSVTISANATNVCAGTSVTITASPVNPGTTPTYQWYKNTLPVATGVAYTYTPVNGDAVYVILTSNATPCATGTPATSNTLNFTVNPVLPVSIFILDASPGAVCLGTSKTFFALPTNGGATPIFQWKVNGANVGTNANNFTYAPLHNDVVSCVMVSSAVCPSVSPAISNNITMTVNSTVASVSIVSDLNTVCAGTTVTYTATPVNGGTIPVYQWYKGTTPVGTDSPTYTYTPVNGDVIKVVMTSNATPCLMGSPATSNLVTMVVNPILNASVIVSPSLNPVCTGTSVTYTAAPTNGGSAPTYEWFKNSVSVATGNTYAYIPANGDQIYVIMTSNATPCLAGSPATSNTVTVVLNPLPTATISGTTTICAGANATLSVSLTGTAPWSITYSNGVTPVTVNNIPGTSNPYTFLVSPAANAITTYTVTSVTDSNGCTNSGTGSAAVTVRPVIGALVAGSNQLLCYGSAAATLSAGPATGGSGSFNYQWQSSPNNVTWGDINLATAMTYAPGSLFITTYYRLIATDAAGCGTATSNTVTVTVADPLSIPDISSAHTICYNTIPNLLSGSAALGGHGSYTYVWQRKPAGGGWSSIPASNSLTYQPAALTVTTTYRLIAVDNVAPSCGSTISNEIIVTVQTTTLPGTIGNDQLIAIGSTPTTITSLTLGSGDGTITYTWESSTDSGANYAPVGGATAVDYSPGILTQETWFRRIAISTLNAAACSAASAPVKITVSFMVSAKVMLEGAVVAGTMTAGVGFHPLTAQPYGNVTPFFHTGTESVGAIPVNVIDWVFVELRQATSPELATRPTIFARRAAFVKTDGSVVDLDGTSPVSFGNISMTIGNNLYIVIRHRNHLAVMSANAPTVTLGVYNYDFTTGLAQVFGGGSGFKAIGGTFAMVAGDITQDGNMFVTDYNAWASTFGATNGYFAADLNFDGSVFVTDYNKWATNFGSTISTGIKSASLKPKYSSSVPR